MKTPTAPAQPAEQTNSAFLATGTLERFGLLVANADELIRIQIKPLLMCLFEQPERHAEIIERMTRLFDAGKRQQRGSISARVLPFPSKQGGHQ